MASSGRPKPCWSEAYGDRRAQATAKVAAGAPLRQGAPAMPRLREFHRRADAAAGFTLIELLVVLAILGLLIGLVAPPVIKYFGRAKTDVAKVDIRNIES